MERRTRGRMERREGWREEDVGDDTEEEER